MKNINLHTLFLGTLFFFALCSCEKEDDLNLSEKKTTRFDLPQGNHDFDDQIVEWYDDYGTAVLYKFSNADLNYHFTSSSNDVNYDVKVEAQEAGIRAAVQFLKEDFFDLYTDEVKKKLFPSKILMAGMLYQNDNYVPLWDTISDKNTYFPKGCMVRGIDHITLSHVDNDFANRILKPAYRKRLKIAMNRTFFQFLMKPYDEGIKKLDMSDILNTFASYSLVSEESAATGVKDPNSSDNWWYKEEDMHKLGFLEHSLYWNWGFLYPDHWRAPDKESDFYSYLGFIFAQTKSELHSNPIYMDNLQIKKKCEYLVQAFAELGIDLHTIGGKE